MYTTMERHERQMRNKFKALLVEICHMGYLQLKRDSLLCTHGYRSREDKLKNINDLLIYRFNRNLYNLPFVTKVTILEPGKNK